MELRKEQIEALGFSEIPAHPGFYLKKGIAGTITLNVTPSEVKVMWKKPKAETYNEIGTFPCVSFENLESALIGSADIWRPETGMDDLWELLTANSREE